MKKKYGQEFAYCHKKGNKEKFFWKKKKMTNKIEVKF